MHRTCINVSLQLSNWMWNFECWRFSENKWNHVSDVMTPTKLCLMVVFLLAQGWTRFVTQPLKSERDRNRRCIGGNKRKSIWLPLSRYRPAFSNGSFPRKIPPKLEHHRRLSSDCCSVYKARFCRIQSVVPLCQPVNGQVYFVRNYLSGFRTTCHEKSVRTLAVIDHVCDFQVGAVMFRHLPWYVMLCPDKWF